MTGGGTGREGWGVGGRMGGEREDGFPEGPACHSRKAPPVIPASFKRESIFNGNPGERE